MTPTPETGRNWVHVYPLNDLQPHRLDAFRCVCGPRLVEGIVVHNAFDRRERYEVAPEKVRLS